MTETQVFRKGAIWGVSDEQRGRKWSPQSDVNYLTHTLSEEDTWSARASRQNQNVSKPGDLNLAFSVRKPCTVSGTPFCILLWRSIKLQPGFTNTFLLRNPWTGGGNSEILFLRPRHSSNAHWTLGKVQFRSFFTFVEVYKSNFYSEHIPGPVGAEPGGAPTNAFGVPLNAHLTFYFPKKDEKNGKHTVTYTHVYTTGSHTQGFVLFWPRQGVRNRIVNEHGGIRLILPVFFPSYWKCFSFTPQKAMQKYFSRNFKF